MFDRYLSHRKCNGCICIIIWIISHTNCIIPRTFVQVKEEKNLFYYRKRNGTVLTIQRNHNNTNVKFKLQPIFGRIIVFFFSSYYTIHSTELIKRKSFVKNCQVNRLGETSIKKKKVLAIEFDFYFVCDLGVYFTTSYKRIEI